MTSAQTDFERHVFTVSELNRTVRDLLENGLGEIWIEGEISNLARPASGHMYFSLKDRDAQVRCALFKGRGRRLDFAPEAGMMVRARARVGLYEARGDYQLIIEHLEPAGAGALARAFEELKKRLAAEGLFDNERKRTPPALPARIGVVTSTSGAAVRDVLHVLARRFPSVPIVLYPVPVQGERAAPAIANMLAKAGRRAECDVLLLVRGGGSLEDLWPFNEEIVARAIVDCPLPVISGVGHEVDITIADFAADRRAPTPSAAAELVVPDASAWLRNLANLDRRLRAVTIRRLRQGRDRHAGLRARLERQHPQKRLQQLQQRRDELELRLDRARRRLFATRRDRLVQLQSRLQRVSPSIRIERLRERTRQAGERLHRAMQQDLRTRDRRLAGAVRALEAVSPLATLGRGYALVLRQDDGSAVTDAAAVARGDALEVRLAKGRIDATVTNVDPESDD